MDNWLTITELAERLNLRRTWVRDKVTARKIPHHRPGRHVRFSPEDVAAIEEMTREPVISAPSPIPRQRQLGATHPPGGPVSPPPPGGPKEDPAPTRRRVGAAA